MEQEPVQTNEKLEALEALTEVFYSDCGLQQLQLVNFLMQLHDKELLSNAEFFKALKLTKKKTKSA